MSVTTVIDERQNTWVQNEWFHAGYTYDNIKETWTSIHGEDTHIGTITWLDAMRTHCTVFSHDHLDAPRPHDLCCLDGEWICDCEARRGHCWHRMLAEFARTNILVRRESRQEYNARIDREIPNGEPFTGIYEGLCGKGHTCLD